MSIEEVWAGPPGGYTIVRDTEGRQVCWMRLPCDEMGRASEARGWSILEDEFGNVTISPSISLKQGDKELFHGFLTQGRFIW